METKYKKKMFYCIHSLQNKLITGTIQTIKCLTKYSMVIAPEPDSKIPADNKFCKVTDLLPLVSLPQYTCLFGILTLSVSLS